MTVGGLNDHAHTEGLSGSDRHCLGKVCLIKACAVSIACGCRRDRPGVRIRPFFTVGHSDNKLCGVSRRFIGIKSDPVDALGMVCVEYIHRMDRLRCALERRASGPSGLRMAEHIRIAKCSGSVILHDKDSGIEE